MDAFFASVELLNRPDLAGQPVVVGGRRRPRPAASAAAGNDTTPAAASASPEAPEPDLRLRDYVGRGVATTCTYAARAYGVRSGMGLMKAAQLAPDAILLPADFEAYRRHSRAFKEAVAELAPVIEDRGIDEIYIDLTEVPGAQEAIGHDPYGGVRALAQDIRNSVRARTGLTCSMGVTPNKLLSKMASEFNKPDGLALLTLDDLEAQIWPLPVGRIHGIGPKAAAKLQAMGIDTIGQLAAWPLAGLQERFGPRWAGWLHRAAHGQDERPVQTHSEPVSMSRETTFDRDLHAVRDRAELSALFTRLCTQVAADLKRKGYAARTIGIKLRFEDFRIVTRDQTLAEATADAAAIRAAAGQCLKRAPLERRLRLLGVRAAGLERQGA